MKLLHRHIFANVALACLAAVGVLTSIMMLGSALQDLLGRFLVGQLAPETFIQLVGLSVPVVASYVLPAGVLTGVLLVLGRMSADREITAIRSAGVSVAGISAPIFLFALLGTGLSLAVNFYYMPQAKVAYEKMLAEAVRSNPLNFIVPKTFIRDFPGKVVFVGENKNLKLKDVWVWDLDKQSRAKEVYHAERADLAYDETNNSFQVKGYNVTVESRDSKNPEDFSGDARGFGHFGTFSQTLSLQNITGVHKVNVKTPWLTLDQLLAEWRRLGQNDPKVPREERERQRIKLQTVIQEKASTAFSVLSFALIAIPLGIKVSRKETSANLGVALALALTYYFATIVVGWFDNKPDLRPDLLMWLPNIGFQVLGMWMFYRADRS
jgi:lipopolysaccharide export system permease protein